MYPFNGNSTRNCFIYVGIDFILSIYAWCEWVLCAFVEGNLLNHDTTFNKKDNAKAIFFTNNMITGVIGLVVSWFNDDEYFKLNDMKIVVTNHKSKFSY